MLIWFQGTLTGIILLGTNKNRTIVDSSQSRDRDSDLVESKKSPSALIWILYPMHLQLLPRLASNHSVEPEHHYMILILQLFMNWVKPLVAIHKMSIHLYGCCHGLRHGHIYRSMYQCYHYLRKADTFLQFLAFTSRIQVFL